MSMVKGILLDELSKAIAKSKYYSEMINTALSEPKKNLYKKKLKKNNKAVADLVIALDKIGSK